MSTPRSPEDGPVTALAFVLTRAAPKVAPDAVVRAYAKLAPEAPALVADGVDKEVSSFRLADGSGIVHVATMPGPVPDGEADEAASLSLAALSEDWTLPKHKGHLVVASLPGPGLDAVATSVMATRVAAAVAEATSAVAVYWGAGGVTHPKDFFVQAASGLTEDELPLPLWCGVSIAGEARDRLSLLSYGFEAQFGLPDLLVVVPQAEAATGLELLFDLLVYVLRRGKKIPAGETVGRTAREKLAVTYVPSPAQPGGKVWRVELPGRSP